MTIHLDTSVLIDALSGTRRSLTRVERAVAAGHVLSFSRLWTLNPQDFRDLPELELYEPA